MDINKGKEVLKNLVLIEELIELMKEQLVAKDEEIKRLREALEEIKSYLPANPKLLLEWEIKTIVEDILEGK